MAKAFGSITIIDVTDIGEFSVYPMSNMPLTIVYDPDSGTSGTYTPTWSSSNPLELTPVVYYGGTQLSLTASGLSVEWTKLVGTTSTSLNANETISNGVLSVKANQFTTSIPMITYKVTATYIEPTSEQTLTAVGQITFSLVKNSSAVRNVQIIGENVFKYDSDKKVDKDSIVLTANVTNTTIDDWQYSTDGSTWTSLGISTTTCTITAAKFPSGGDKAIIRVKAHDNQNASSYYYDTITVMKLYDGTNASTKVFITLSNESQMIPCTSTGATTSTAFNGASTLVSVYLSGAETSIGTNYVMNNTSTISENTLYITEDGIVGSYDSSTQTYSATSWGTTNSGDTASVTFSYTYDGQTQSKKMSFVKVQPGADGKTPTVYSLDSSLDAIVYDTDSSSYKNDTVVLTASSKKGEEATTSYSGYLTIELDDGASNIVNQTVTGTYTLSGIGTTYKPTNNIICKLYDSSSKTTLLDTQTITIIANGKTGQQGNKGDTGAPAINVVLGNYSDTIPTTAKFMASTATKIDIPFDVYCGSKKITATVSTPATICNGNVSYSTSGTGTTSVLTCTSSATGHIYYNIASGKSLGSTLTGTTTFTFNIPAQSVTIGNDTFSLTASTVLEVYSWALSPASTDGIVFQLTTPSGYVFSNGVGELTVAPYMLSGSTDITSSIISDKCVWEVYKSGYTTITSTSNTDDIYKVGNILHVKGSGVDGYLSIKCTVTYDGNPYIQYTSLIDKTDPVQLFLYSSIGDKITNGQGVGYVYCKVVRNDEEIDALPSNVQFVTSKPSSLTTNGYYYLIDTSAKTITLKKASSSSAWDDATDYTYDGTYKWTYRDKDNNSLPETSGVPYVTVNGNNYSLSTTGKVIYIDADLIAKKISIDVEVDI